MSNHTHDCEGCGEDLRSSGHAKGCEIERLSAEVSAAQRLCEIYFNIASEAIGHNGDDQVREMRDEALAAVSGSPTPGDCDKCGRSLVYGCACPTLPDNQDSFYPCKRVMLQQQPYSDCFPAENCDGCDCWREPSESVIRKDRDTSVDSREK